MEEESACLVLLLPVSGPDGEDGSLMQEAVSIPGPIQSGAERQTAAFTMRVGGVPSAPRLSTAGKILALGLRRIHGPACLWHVCLEDTVDGKEIATINLWVVRDPTKRRAERGLPWALLSRVGKLDRELLQEKNTQPFGSRCFFFG